MTRKTRGALLEDDVITGTPAVSHEAALVPAPAVAPPADDAQLVALIERLATNPAVDPDKLDKLLALQERAIAKRAAAEFWAAFAALQGELPTINEDGRIVVDGKVRSTYATNEQLQEAIRPILQRHGFALTFRHTVTDKAITVRGILAHAGGHTEADEFSSPPDAGGQMNAIQRIGSTRSYGMRYTTIALLNIVSRAKADRDDDGVRSAIPDPPEGYAAWLATLEGPAAEGMASFAKAWNASRPDWRKHLTTHDPNTHAALKTRANQAGAPKP